MPKYVLAPGPGPGLAAVQAGGDLASLSAQPGGGLLHTSTGEDGAHHRSQGVIWSHGATLYMGSYGYMGLHVVTCYRLGQAWAGGDLVPAAEEGRGLHRDQWRVRGQCEGRWW